MDPDPITASGPMIDERIWLPLCTTAPGKRTEPSSTTSAPTTQSMSTTELMIVAEGSIVRRLGSPRAVDDVSEVVLRVATLQDVDVRLQVEPRRARVQPVGVVGHRKERARGGERRKRLALDTHATFGGDAIKSSRFEDVGARVDEIRGRFVGRGLFDESNHPPVLVRGHDAKVRGVFNRVKGDRHLRPVLAMEREKLRSRQDRSRRHH